MPPFRGKEAEPGWGTFRVVLALIVQGRTNQEIAEECFLSINSIKTYIRSAYRKVGISHRAQAVAWAIQHGFPPPTERT